MTAPRVLVDLSVDPAGGAATYVAGFAEGLIAAADLPSRDAIVVLVSTHWADAHADDVAALQSAGITVDPVSVPAAGTWRARVTRRRLLGHAAERHRCAAVFVPRDVAPRIGMPYIVLARNRYAWQKYSSYVTADRRASTSLVRTVARRCARGALRFTARRSARGASKVLAVSNALTRFMPEDLEIGVVHHGCSMAESDRSPAPPATGDVLIVTMIANVSPNKRIEVVIDGVAAAVAEGRATELRVHGKKVDPEYFERLELRAAGALGGSIFKGPAFGDDLVAAYRDAHILAVGGSFESFCFPLVEGMRAGCVIVAPHDALVEEICGDTAVTYDEGDPASFASALETAAREWSARSRAGIERSRGFTWARTAEKTMEFVRAAVSAP